MGVLGTQDGGVLLTEDGSLFLLEDGDPSVVTGDVRLRQDKPANQYYDIGDVPVWTATFVDLDGVPSDPLDVEFRLRLPNGTVTTYTDGVDDEVASTATGVFVLTAPELAAHGVHWCRVDGTDPTAAAERPLGVRSSKFST